MSSQERHSVQSRLAKWGRWVQEPRPELSRSRSVFGRIQDDRENAGIHGDGIRYDLVTVDGDTVSCPPDGGMSAAVEWRGKALAHDMRCRETARAVGMLPQALRAALQERFVVPPREKLRSATIVGLRLGITGSAAEKRLERAYDRIARDIYGPFEVVEVAAADTEPSPTPGRGRPGPTPSSERSAAATLSDSSVVVA